MRSVRSRFLMAQSYAGFIIYLSWASGTIRPAYKRAVALAFINMVSSLGNIAGSSVISLSPHVSCAHKFQIHLAFDMGTELQS